MPAYAAAVGDTVVGDKLFYVAATAGALVGVGTGLPSPAATTRGQARLTSGGTDAHAPFVAAVQQEVALDGSEAGAFKIMFNEKLTRQNTNAKVFQCGADNICNNDDDTDHSSDLEAAMFSEGDGSTRALPLGLVTLQVTGAVLDALVSGRKYWLHLPAGMYKDDEDTDSPAVDAYFFTSGAGTGGSQRYHRHAQRRCTAAGGDDDFHKAIQLSEMLPQAAADLCFTKCAAGCVGKHCYCDGLDPAWTAATPVLCLPPQQCQAACSANSLCNGFEVHSSLNLCILTRYEVCDAKSRTFTAHVFREWDHYQKLPGRACTDIGDFSTKAGELYVTDRVHVGVDFALEPGKAASLEVTAVADKQLATLADSEAPVVQLEDSRPTSAVSPGSPIVLEFNEAIVLSGGAQRAFVKDVPTLSAAGGTFAALDVVSKRFLVLAATGLQADTTYYVELEAGVVTDVAGNANAAVNTRTQTHFEVTTAGTTMEVYEVEGTTAGLVLLMSLPVNSIGSGTAILRDCGTDGACTTDDTQLSDVLRPNPEWTIGSTLEFKVLARTYHGQNLAPGLYSLTLEANLFDSGAVQNAASTVEFTVPFRSEDPFIGGSNDRIMVVPCGKACGTTGPASGLAECGGRGGPRTLTAVAVGETTTFTSAAHGYGVGDTVVLAGLVTTVRAMLRSEGHPVVAVTADTFSVGVDSQGATVTLDSATATRLQAASCIVESTWTGLMPVTASAAAASTAATASHYLETPEKYCPVNMAASSDPRLTKHQCYSKCVQSNCTRTDCWCAGVLPAIDNAATNSLCLDQEACAALCRELASCTGYDMHMTIPRCFLNTEACSDPTNLLADSAYAHFHKTIFIPREHPVQNFQYNDYGKAVAVDQGFSSTGLLRYAPVQFSSAGKYKLCFCDSDLQGRLVGVPATRCSTPEEFNIEIGKIHVSGVSCLINDMPLLRRGECVSMFHGGLRCYRAGHSVTVDVEHGLAG
mmetsp:Transcript_18092/g.44150  ORF Transcript_18092/g.44150 Transcript_18092/m.44150 type:complete len:978 (+) Transcript_18092:3-2936(+)